MIILRSKPRSRSWSIRSYYVSVNTSCWEFCSRCIGIIFIYASHISQCILLHILHISKIFTIIILLMILRIHWCILRNISKALPSPYQKLLFKKCYELINILTSFDVSWHWYVPIACQKFHFNCKYQHRMPWLWRKNWSVPGKILM